ncbi:uncharacterized protein BP01DRAFT_388336 [Aspergillus saccharolyticus JOP 1030-1]|uniref:Rootletin n=1 Tax=Aspergillus saccharolyticus JOP 1030-1 TaxID=1450539 RepID=A0A318ZY73_9EURO|nr:hypothetical protein BP01DRAFT_388336 [Aspergillus saccharolyticus JOP 1030-1]PYH49263.1 hypothetical protein BP01DRAFT_388336 [Aspergillus saccharolyticus JOP 1030-1]
MSASMVSTTASGVPPNTTLTAVDTDDTYEAEELLLLQIAAANNELLSPQLKAVMATQDIPSSNNNSVDRCPSPLLMERPRSSGIDLTAFSFAKPAQGRKPFSLQSAVKPSSSTVRPDVTAQCEHRAAEISPETVKSLKGSSTHESQKKLPSKAEQKPTRASVTPSEHVQSGSSLENAVVAYADNFAANSAEHSEPLGHKERTISHSSHDQLVQERPNSKGDKHGSPLVEGHGASDRTLSAHEAQDSVLQNQLAANIQLAQSHPTDREIEMNRVSKRRRSSKSQTSRNVRPSLVTPDDTSSLSEEHLFHLLIGRIKAREENEAAAVESKGQMEACISGLTEENQALKSQIEILDKVIRKKTSDLAIHKTQISAWKSKLSNIKGFLNQLGSDFHNLRGDANLFLAAKKCARNERAEIDKSISEAKAQAARALEAASKGREQLFRSESQVELLKQARSATEEKTQYVQGQLSDEKRRSRLLEQYIQDSSRTHALKLGQIKTDQLAILKQFETVFRTLSVQEKTSQNVIQQAIGTGVDKCFSTLDTLYDRILKNDSGAKDHMDSVKTVIMESELVQLLQLTKERHETDASSLAKLNEQLQGVTTQLATNANLFERISKDTDQLVPLNENLGHLVPLTETFKCSIDILKDNETKLLDQVTHLQADLCEARKAQAAEVAALELGRHGLEKAQMESEMQKVLKESEVIAEGLRAKDLENKAFQYSLLEAKSQTQEAESRINQLESEVAVLQDEVTKKGTQVREELSRASIVAREQIKARYEQQHRDLLKDKCDLAQSVEVLKKQLDDANSTLAEITSTRDKEKTDRDHLLESKEKEIEKLTCHQFETVAKLTEQEEELRRLVEQEALGRAQYTSLQAQHDEINRKFRDLEDDLSNTRGEKDKILAESQHKLDALLQDNLKKQEECVKTQERLTSALTERADLESHKLKTKDEIHGLFKRVQESELWVNKLKELLDRTNLVIPKDTEESWSNLEAALISLTNKEDHDKLEQFSSKATRTATTVPDSQPTICSSPARQTNKLDNNCSMNSTCLLDSGIVPFSSIQDSPLTDCLFSGNESYDLTAMLIFTPENDRVESDPKSEISNTDNKGRQRTVTFETDVAASQSGKRKISDAETSHRPDQESSVDGLDDRFMPSQRTYSKQQQLPAARSQAKSKGSAAGAREVAQDAPGASTPRSTVNKRTKVSFDTITTTSQTKTVTEYFDRKSSPEKLASGSSRPTLNGSQTESQKRPSRGGRGGGRRSRGE